MGTLQYVKTLLKDKNVASIAPTSSFGIGKIFRLMDFAKADVIVEYGPGGGCITRPMLKKMKPNARLIVIETNDDFADHLEQSIDDPRLEVVRDSAENIESILAQRGIKEANYILSGIPFSLFDVEKKDRILVATKNALGESGSFIVYQFLLSPGDRKQDIKRKLNQHMHIVNADYEMLCLPPIRIYQAVNGSLARQLKERVPSQD
jgi:phospholipid N-methyltransferase